MVEPRTVVVPEGYEVAFVPVGWRQKAMYNHADNTRHLIIDLIDGLLLADRLTPSIQPDAPPAD
jgi:hypothetical protein